MRAIIEKLEHRGYDVFPVTLDIDVWSVVRQPHIYAMAARRDWCGRAAQKMELAQELIVSILQARAVTSPAPIPLNAPGQPCLAAAAETSERVHPGGRPRRIAYKRILTYIR